MGKAEYKVKNGKLVKAQVKAERDKILNVKITGDFFLHPEELIEDLEKALVGSPLNEAELTKIIKGIIKERKAVLLGVSPEDFAKCIVMAGERDG